LCCIASILCVALAVACGIDLFARAAAEKMMWCLYQAVCTNACLLKVVVESRRHPRGHILGFAAFGITHCMCSGTCFLLTAGAGVRACTVNSCINMHILLHCV
jgi:hypothetical protein